MSVRPAGERQLQTEGRRLPSLRRGCTPPPGEHPGGLAVTRGPLAGAGAEELRVRQDGEPGRAWILHQAPGPSARDPTEQKQGGTETKQTAPLKPPEIHVSGMFDLGLLFPAAGYLNKTNLLKASTPKLRALCVPTSGLRFRNKPPLLFGLDCIQGRWSPWTKAGAAHVPAKDSNNQTFRPSRGFLARGSARLAVGGAS